MPTGRDDRTEYEAGFHDGYLECHRKIMAILAAAAPFQLDHRRRLPEDTLMGIPQPRPPAAA
jgi:hypothetical protein